MGARLLLALSAASFMPAAGGYAAGLAGPRAAGPRPGHGHRGLTVAIIAGVPLGVLLGDALGLARTFLGVAAMAAFSLVGILAWLPRQPPVPRPAWASAWRWPGAPMSWRCWRPAC